jgi:hypothetical protein
MPKNYHRKTVDAQRVKRALRKLVKNIGDRKRLSLAQMFTLTIKAAGEAR